MKTCEKESIGCLVGKKKSNHMSETFTSRFLNNVKLSVSRDFPRLKLVLNRRFDQFQWSLTSLKKTSETGRNVVLNSL